ncbi:MAG: FRG domain-containing protein [Candidatus Poribacteria bacterium]|nr:FRG domain-containing protein [Candidatus Poribacteria bacterium]
MKIVFSSNDTADLSVIQSVRVSDTDGKVKILVRHKTKRTEKVSAINFRKKIRYSPDVEITTEFAEEIANDIENLTKNPNMPIEQVIKLRVWARGYLQVNLDTATEAQATIALARLCWRWIFGKNHVPTDKQLELRTGLDVSDIAHITSSDDYKQCVEDLMFSTRTREEFKAWIDGYRNMPVRFGNHMRLCEDDVQRLVESVESRHMSNPYKYAGKPLTPRITQELIQELFAEQTVRKREIIEKVDEAHRKGGGLPSRAQFHHPVTLALSNMRRYGLVENPEFGVWFILPTRQGSEEVNPVLSETAEEDYITTAKEVSITTLNDFMGWTQQFAPGQYLFRGVSDESYEIEASAYRRLQTEVDRDFEKFFQINKELIRDARLRGHAQKNGRELKDLEILAELQHFRAATCMIDFTYSAQIALWFACGQDSENPSNGKVIAVRNKPPRFKEITPDLLEEPIDYFLQDSDESQSKQLYQWQPWRLNNRIGAQQSIFLFGDFKIDPDETCIIIGDSKQDIRTALQQGANITEAILFPDFDGFAQLRSHQIPYAPLGVSEYIESADQAFQRAEYAEAIANYDVVISLDPADAEAYYNRGLAKYHLGHLGDAREDIQSALDLAGEIPDLIVRIGQLLQDIESRNEDSNG